MAEFDRAPQLEDIFPLTHQLLTPRERAKLLQECALTVLELGENALPSPDRFPERLKDWKWTPMRAFLPDLALLELHFFRSRSADELPLRGFEGVAQASEPDWYSARFRFDPAIAFLESEWPLDEIFAQPLSSHAPAPGCFLVYRLAGEPKVRRLKENEEQLIRPLSLGVPLGKVLERKNGPELDALTFHRWMESGLLRAIDWAAV